MLNIQDTQEYKIASGEIQMRATSSRELFGYPIQNAMKMGFKISEHTVKVVCNDGQEHEVPLSVNFAGITIGSNLKRVSIDRENKRVSGFMLKGSSPKTKSAIYFATSDFENSEGLKQLNKIILDKHVEYRNGVVKQIQEDLRSGLPEIAKNAINELPNIIKKALDKNQAAHDWFKDNGFMMQGIIPGHFKALVSLVLETGFIYSSFTTSTEDDKWGHTRGTSVEIDFRTKKISTSIWSSDD